MNDVMYNLLQYVNELIRSLTRVCLRLQRIGRSPAVVERVYNRGIDNLTIRFGLNVSINGNSGL